MFSAFYAMFLTKNSIKVASWFSPPVPLPYHLVYPAQYDMDVGGVELAFVIEAVTHEVAVDGHPRERGRTVVGRGLRTLRGACKHVGVSGFKVAPAQGSSCLVISSCFSNTKSKRRIRKYLFPKGISCRVSSGIPVIAE